MLLTKRNYHTHFYDAFKRLTKVMFIMLLWFIEQVIKVPTLQDKSIITAEY